MPTEIEAMSLWQLGCVVAGWNRAQGGEPEVEAPTREQFETLMQSVH